MIVPYLLVLLFPLGVYLLLLATINRRERPFMISGIWDALMLSLAISGVLLWVGPAVLGVFYERGLLPSNNDASTRQFTQIWSLYPWVWISYYVLVLFGQCLMMVSRRNKTIVYNVDAAALETLVGTVLVDKGFRISRGDGLIIFERQANGVSPAEFAGTGAVDVEGFLPLRHATLHWHVDDDRLRRTLDNEINTRLDGAITPENPSAGWMLALSGVIFGAVFLGAIYLILATLLGRGA